MNLRPLGFGMRLSCNAVFCCVKYMGIVKSATVAPREHPVLARSTTTGRLIHFCNLFLEISFCRFQALDWVINIEASHCYPDFPGFLAEVARVLRPGGHFLYADFRFRDGLADWEQAIAAAPLPIVHSRDIRAEILRGMDCNAARSLTLIHERLPRCLHSLGRDFAGVPGSRVYVALQTGELAYRSWCFRKV